MAHAWRDLAPPGGALGSASPRIGLVSTKALSEGDDEKPKRLTSSPLVRGARAALLSWSGSDASDVGAVPFGLSRAHLEDRITLSGALPTLPDAVSSTLPQPAPALQQ